MSFFQRLRAGVAAFSNPPSEGEVAASSGAAATPAPEPAPVAGPWLDRARRGTIKGILVLLAAVVLLWLGFYNPTPQLDRPPRPSVELAVPQQPQRCL